VGPLVAVVEEPEQRRQQRGGVERVGVVVLAEHASAAHAALEDIGADLVGCRLPPPVRSRSAPMWASLAARSRATQHTSFDHT
jgi:hypothetical protein